MIRYIGKVTGRGYWKRLLCEMCWRGKRTSVEIQHSQRRFGRGVCTGTVGTAG